MLRSKFYVCPVCNNVIHATGEACVSCHGINLPPLQAETPDAEHVLRVQMLDDELHVQVDHPMSKQHHLLFMAAGSADRMQFARLYPEGPAEARFNPRGVQALYFCCNKDGLFSAKLSENLCAIADAANSAAPSPATALMLLVNSPPAPYAAPSCAKISSVHV